MSDRYHVSIVLEFPDPNWKPYQEGTCEACYKPLPDPPMIISTDPGYDDGDHLVCDWECALVMAAGVVASTSEVGHEDPRFQLTLLPSEGIDTLLVTGIGTGIPPEGP